jgi:tetratricopeptide (TPR) repeat protein
MNKTPRHERAQSVMLLMRAKSLLQDREMERAMKDLDEALRLNPEMGEALMVRATALLHQEDYQRALEDVERRLQMDPPEPLALLTRGNIRAFRGEFEPALADFNEFLRQQPASVFALRARALNLARIHRFEEAVADLDEALRVEPDSADVYLERGRVNQDRGCYAAARADYQKSLDLGPNQPGIHNQLAWMLAACPHQEYRDGARAVQLARRGCALTKWSDANLLDTLACAYAECGQFDDALRSAHEALEISAAEARASVEKHIQLFGNRQPARFVNSPAQAPQG